MLFTKLDVGPVRGFVRSFHKGHIKSLERANKGVAFKTSVGLKGYIAQGGGTDTPERAALSRRIAAKRGRKALRGFAQMVGYRVGRVAGGFVSEIGLDVAARRGGRSMPRRKLQHVIGGHKFPVTPATQRAILRKARRGNRSVAFGRGRNRRSIIPRVGTIIEFPERQVVAGFARSHLGPARRDLAQLYERAQRGERWARQWWKESA